MNGQIDSKNFVLVPEAVINEIREYLVKILSREERADDTTSANLEDWITEKDTQRLLGKKTTTLYNLRVAGKLVSTKIGNKTFYSKSSIMKLLDNNKRGRTK